MSSIFLSHNLKDKPFVRKLGADLWENGVKAWIDEVELKVGDSLTTTISKAITESQYVGVIISPHSIKSKWVEKELSWALSEEIRRQKVKVLPIFLGGCAVPDAIADKLYADFSDRTQYEKSLKLLLKSMDIEIKDVKIVNTNVENKDLQSDLEGNISIVGIDKNKISKPDLHKDLYNIYFELSAHPQKLWKEIFDSVWKNAFYLMKRKAWIEGKYLVIYASTDEIKKYHLPILHDKIKEVNKFYLDELNRQKGIQERVRIEQEKERLKIDGDLDDIDF